MIEHFYKPDPATLKLAVPYLYLDGSKFPLFYINYAAQSAVQGMQQLRLYVFICFYRDVIFLLVSNYVAVKLLHGGIIGSAIASICREVSVAVIFAVHFTLHYRKQRRAQAAVQGDTGGHGAATGGWVSPLTVKLQWEDWAVFTADTAKLTVVGLCGQVCAQLSGILVSRLGTTDMAGNALLQTIMAYPLIFSAAFSTVVTTLGSRCEFCNRPPACHALCNDHSHVASLLRLQLQSNRHRRAPRRPVPSDGAGADQRLLAGRPCWRGAAPRHGPAVAAAVHDGRTGCRQGHADAAHCGAIHFGDNGGRRVAIDGKCGASRSVCNGSPPRHLPPMIHETTSIEQVQEFGALAAISVASTVLYVPLVIYLKGKSEVTLASLLGVALVQQSVVFLATGWLCAVRIPRRLRAGHRVVK